MKIYSHMHRHVYRYMHIYKGIYNFTHIESDAPFWVKHTERGLPTSGYSKVIAHETGVNVE